MVNLSLVIKNDNGEILCQSNETQDVTMVYKNSYQEGDSITLLSSKPNVYLCLKLDDAMETAFVYLSGCEYVFPIPFGQKKVCYSPKSFSGDLHLLRARMATKEEIEQYKNLAKNEYDTHENNSCFPHAYANVETRGEATFAAKNAINGNIENRKHGKWPYESWGINKNSEAEITISFGRTVCVDKIVLYLRADFPHDNFWERVTFTFSDGSSLVQNLTKTEKGQTILFEQKNISWVKLGQLIQSDDPSEFPALSQFEVYGRG